MLKSVVDCKWNELNKIVANKNMNVKIDAIDYDDLNN
jgi:hypothetical protein